MVGSPRFGAAVLAAFVIGCSSPLTQPGPDGGAGGQGGGPFDAGPDLGVDVVADANADLAADVATDASSDAAACDCRVEGLTLTMSWACFCAKFGCRDRQPACASNRTGYPACGLTADNFNTVAGPSISVWDESGALVGRQYASDTSYYQCPSDPSVQAGHVRAGRFPDASCAEVVGCTCTNGKTTCGAADAGADARDGGGADAGCSGPAIGCTVGSPGGQCSDAGQPAVCINGQWTCQPPTIPFSQCACVGAPRPGCTCGSSGWSCPAVDGGH